MSSSKKSSSKKVASSPSYSSSSSSSSIADLFGPKPSSVSNPHSSSSSGVFDSVFGPASMGRGRSDYIGQVGNVRHGYDNGAPLGKGENSNGANYYNQKQTDQPFCYDSSIYYGGQDEVYSPSTRSSETHFKRNEQDEDPNSASRGNWWQGSLYY